MTEGDRSRQKAVKPLIFISLAATWIVDTHRSACYKLIIIMNEPENVTGAPGTLTEQIELNRGEMAPG
ncbi:MAG: hypothetical protein WCP20_13870 [Desulfuromonadales bacterium]